MKKKKYSRPQPPMSQSNRFDIYYDMGMMIAMIFFLLLILT